MIDKLSDPLSSCCEVYGGLLRKLISSGAFDLVDRFLSIGLDYESISIETSKFGLDNWKTLQKNFPKNSKLADLSNSEIAKCTSWIERFNENYSTPQTIPPVNVIPPESELEALDISVLLSLSLMISNQKGKLKDSILSIALKKDYNKTIEHAIEHLDINAAESFEDMPFVFAFMLLNSLFFSVIKRIYVKKSSFSFDVGDLRCFTISAVSVEMDNFCVSSVIKKSK